MCRFCGRFVVYALSLSCRSTYQTGRRLIGRVQGSFSRMPVVCRRAADTPGSHSAGHSDERRLSQLESDYGRRLRRRECRCFGILKFWYVQLCYVCWR